MTPRWHILAIGCVLWLAASGRADTVDDTVEALMRTRRIPGVSLAVFRDGELVKVRGYGVTTTEDGEPVTPDTLFQAGELSMSVTALGALHLVQRGRLQLDEDVNRTLLDWELAGNTFTKTEKVTLRHLLSHSAGIQVNFRGYPPSAPLPTLAQVLAGRSPARSMPVRVDFTPGSRWFFSNGGYAVIQQLIYDVTGEPFELFMRRNVLEPLGMKASLFAQPLPAGRAAQAAAGHNEYRVPLPGGNWVYPELAASGLWSTPSDLARFAMGVQAAWTGRDERVVSRPLAAAMLTRQQADNGLGLFLSGSGASLRFDHGGRTNGFDTQMVAYAARGYGAVVMLNLNDESGAASRVLEAVARAYGWPDYPFQARPPPIADDEPEVTARIQHTFELLREGRIEAQLFTAEFRQWLAPRADTVLRQDLEPLGRVLGTDLLARTVENNTRIYRHRVRFEHEAILASSEVLPNGRIGALTFRVE